MSFKHLKYYPELNQVTGSVNATIVLLQLEYWFEKCKGNKFYKFLECCEHEKYRQGDSWTEELGFTKNEFRTAFAKIGKAYKSKRAFNESQDIFEGKYYASYYDRIKGLTYYIRNNEALEKLLGEDRETLIQEYVGGPAYLGSTETEISIDQESASPISVDYNKLLTSVKDTHTTACVPYDNYIQKPQKTANQPRGKFLDMYSHNWDFEELEKLEDQYISQKVNELQLAAAI
ncbi:hypothetical protein [Cellulosilyticum sp. I15G10I2]|uniref:hypothetical protein n=1 Tax=Cellulosilyticum sp. I15G10I2 TaxID=1892843 RepID=UPI00085CD76D|nr:hypothetical protein [Cellulosilyticum sp. I15G10I2]